MLGANLYAAAGVGPPCHVTDGVHVFGPDGPEEAVGHYTVIEREPRRGEPSGGWNGADADHRRRGRDAAAVIEDDRELTVLALDISDADAEAGLGSVPVMQFDEATRDLGADDARHRLGNGIDHRDVAAKADGGRSDLRADEAAADHDDGLPRFRRAAMARESSRVLSW